MYNPTDASAEILKGSHDKDGNLSSGFMVGAFIRDLNGAAEIYWYGRTHPEKAPFLHIYQPSTQKTCEMWFRKGSIEAPSDPRAYHLLKSENSYSKAIFAINLGSQVLMN